MISVYYELETVQKFGKCPSTVFWNELWEELPFLMATQEQLDTERYIEHA
jgi:hypothetical protein